MENNVGWHSLAPTEEQAKQALKELGDTLTKKDFNYEE